jgi:hypothetical protein
LLRELNSLEGQFLQLSEDIKQHRWDTAARLSGAILITARSDEQMAHLHLRLPLAWAGG